MRHFVIISILTLVFVACAKRPEPGPFSNPLDEYLNLPPKPFNYANPNLPAHITNDPGILAADNMPFTNPITDDGATLGWVLFYDKNLSKNKTIACASCHKQENAFADPLVLSDGFKGGKTARHSMGLTNARFYENGRFFWDERALTLEQQVLLPMQDSVEMGMTLDSVVARVSNLPYYPTLFANAFGDETVTTDRISKALAQFIRSIVSYQSKYDEGRALVANPGLPFPNFTAQENQGKNIFLNPNLGRCAACHGTEGFVAPGPRNNGLDFTSTDLGVGGITNNPGQIGLFKAPSLRNIALRAPYMHDGRFMTLEQVVEHYSTGVKNHPNLSAPLRDPGNNVRLLNLSVADKAALVAFLNTLTDPVLVGDEKFRNPFKP